MTNIHTETMGQITYKAFGKKIQKPGAVIAVQTFLWAWGEDGNHLAVHQFKQSLEMNRLTTVAPSLAYDWISYFLKDCHL